MKKSIRMTKRYEEKVFVNPELYPRPECGVFPCGRVGVCKFSLPRYRRKCPYVIIVNRLADLEDRIERGELLEVVPDDTD
jgi:hypothetical protein